MIFEIDNVELYFKNKPILNGIYLKTETGKVTAILGRNGSGKSCLLDVIFGDLSPKYKLVRLNGKPILKDLYKTGLVTYLPQDNFVLSNLKLHQVLKLFGLQWSHLTRVFPELENYSNQKFKKLSSGEKRLLEIFVVLMSKSKIVLLDEPFNGLSPIMVERVKVLIESEKEQKLIILTDHRYKEVMAVSDVIYLLYNGTTRKIKDPKELESYRYVSEGSFSIS